MEEYLICPANRDNKLYVIKLQDVEIKEKIQMDDPIHKMKTVRIFRDNDK